MKIIELNVDANANFYCPVTGHQILAPEEYMPSPATAFCLPPDADDFSDITPELQVVWDHVLAASGKANAAPCQLWKQFCDALEHRNDLVVFALTSSGIACGPICSTVYLCIDFAHVADEDR